MALAKAWSRILSSHSHTVNTCHPSAVSFRRFLVSRFLFASSFGIQYARFDFGLCDGFWHLWRCQKHPCTKIAFLRLGNTMSGVPGRDRSWSLNRNPARCNTDRNFFSGFVSPDRIRRIRALRSDGVRMSATYAFLGPPRSDHAPQSAAPRSRPEFPCGAVAVGITP